MAPVDKQIFNFTVFLIKDYIDEFKECLKRPPMAKRKYKDID